MRLQLTADCSFPSFSSSLSATHTQSPSPETKKLITKKPYEEKQGGFFSSKKTEQYFSIIARTRMLSWLRCCAQVENYFRSKYSKHGYSLNAEEVAPFIKPGMQKSAAPSIEGPEFSLDELKEKTDNFGSKALIGKGSCGSVYGVKLNNGKTVAVKKLDISNVEFMAQVSLVNGLKHDNLVELLCYFVEGDLRVLAYEFATMGSLHDILHEPQPVQVLDWMQRLRVAVDVVSGLEYLNEKAPPSVGSRFITSKDIILFENYKAKIADYYRSNLSPDMAAQFLKTTGYLAPEYRLTRQFTEKTDVYSLGVVLIELLTGRKTVGDATMPLGLVFWAAPMLNIYRIEECVDPKLNGKYHVRGAAKLGGLALMCVRDDPIQRPNLKFVSKTLRLVVDYNAIKSAEY